MTNIYTVKNEQGQSFEVDEHRLAEAERDGYYPIVRKGDTEHQVTSAQLQMAQAEGFLPLRRSEVSKGESLVRGAAQGATMGLSDELTGIGETIGSTVLGGDKLVDVVKNYHRYRDEARQANKIASEVNPLTYGAGELGGAGATALIPGLGAAQTAKLAAAAPKVASAITSPLAQTIGAGALQGAGYSESSTLPDLLTDIATSAGTSAGIAGAGKLLGAGTKKGLEKVASWEDPAKIPQFLQKHKNTAEAGLTGMGLWNVLQGDPQSGLETLGGAALLHKGPAGALKAQKVMAALPDKYKRILSDAATRGGNALAVSHYMLQQTDPEYRKAITQAQTEEE